MYVQSRKMEQMNLFAKQKQRHRHREQMYGHQGGEKRGRGMNYTTDTMYKIDNQRKPTI